MNRLKQLLIIILLLTPAVSYSISPSDYKALRMKKSKIIFGDGDTLIYKNDTIRILGIDTPEVKNENYGILKDQHLGPEASQFTKKTILESKKIYYIPHKKDRYGRILAHIIVDNELLSVKLIKAGLAYETLSFYGDNGFKEIGKEIIKASKETTRPNFENPNFWRRKNQRKR